MKVAIFRVSWNYCSVDKMHNHLVESTKLSLDSKKGIIVAVKMSQHLTVATQVPRITMIDA